LLGATMIRQIISITLLIFIYVSPVIAGNPREDRFNRETKIDKFIYEAPLFIKGKSLQEIRKIGKLRREFMENKPNSHDPKTINTFITLQFDGLEINGYLKSQDEFWPIQITITKPKWKILNAFDVGTPISRIYKILGHPKEQENNLIKYCGETECVTFFINKKTISKIEFHYYTD
jgi:hypothetical protein